MNRNRMKLNLQFFAGGTEVINREKAEAIIRQQVVNQILQDAPKQSVFMGMAKKLPNMTSNQTRIRVLDFLPTAYWVNGDTGMKQTSSQAWDNVYLNAAELAVIVPIPEAVLDDAEFDIFGEVTPRVIEAIGQRVDSAIIFGDNRPSEWQNDIVTLARQAGNNVPVRSDADYYDLIMSENGLIAKVEESGYIPTGAIAAMGMRSKLRGVRDSNGGLIFKTDMQGSTQYALDGTPLFFPQNGSFDPAIAQLVIGDFKQAVYAIRQDITVKILTEGVIQDPKTKEIAYNLAQQDMVALRIVFRMGWALPNPATRIDMDRTACAFAYLEPTTPSITQKVTFTVSNNVEEPEALKGAIVDVNGARKKTDEAGVAEFDLRGGSYPIKVTLNKHITVNDTILVSGTPIEKDITLIPKE